MNQHTTTREMLDLCLQTFPDNEFIASINDWFNRNRKLTEKQKTALDKIYYDAWMKTKA